MTEFALNRHFLLCTAGYDIQPSKASKLALKILTKGLCHLDFLTFVSFWPFIVFLSGASGSDPGFIGLPFPSLF